MNLEFWAVCRVYMRPLHPVRRWILQEGSALLSFSIYLSSCFEHAYFNGVHTQHVLHQVCLRLLNRRLGHLTSSFTLQQKSKNRLG